MATITESHPPCGLTHDGTHKAEFGKNVKAYAISSLNPLKQFAYYRFPAIGGYFADATRMYANDPTQEELMPEASKKKVIHEIEALKKAAGVKRNIHLYAKSQSPFYAIGGSGSFSSPAIIAPLEQIFPHNQEAFGSQNRKSNLWIYSNNEVRFMVSRELGRIKYNTEIIDMIAKSAIISLIGFVFFYTALAPLACIVITIAALGAYVLMNRFIEWKLDLFAARTLGKHLGNEQKGYEVGDRLFEKIQKQNLEKRRVHFLEKLFITPKGNNLRYIAYPSIQSRIDGLKKHFQ